LQKQQINKQQTKGSLFHHYKANNFHHYKIRKKNKKEKDTLIA